MARQYSLRGVLGPFFIEETGSRQEQIEGAFVLETVPPVLLGPPAALNLIVESWWGPYPVLANRTFAPIPPPVITDELHCLPFLVTMGKLTVR